jgi:hypothetical protein
MKDIRQFFIFERSVTLTLQTGKSINLEFGLKMVLDSLAERPMSDIRLHALNLVGCSLKDKN